MISDWRLPIAERPKDPRNETATVHSRGRFLSGANLQSPIFNRQSSFTLIEVMVAVSIMAILVMLMSAIFHQSSVAWDSGTGRMKANVTARAVLSLMERELSQAVTDPDLGLKIYFPGLGPGGSADLTFWTLDGEAGGADRILRKIRYESPPGGGAIIRHEATLPQAVPYDQQTAVTSVSGGYGQPLVLATNVNVFFEPWPDPQAWSDQAGNDNLPQGVKIRMTIDRADRVSNLAAWSLGPDGRTNRGNPDDPVNADDIGSW